MKKHKNWLLLILVCVSAVVIVQVVLNMMRKTENISLVYIPKIIDESNDFWTSLIEGATTAAEEFGVELEVMAPNSETDYEGQNAYLEQILENTEKPDALLISPVSYTQSTELLHKIKDQGIRLVMIDSSIDADIADIIVSTDNLEAGKKLGAFAAQFLNDGEQVAVIGHVQGSSTAMEREKGFREGLGDKEDAFTEMVYCGSRYEKAYELAMELMEKYPNLGVIAGLNEYSAIGAARAVRDAGVQNKISMVGVDGSQEGINMMEQGIFKGIVIQKPFKMGYLGVKYTIEMLQGKKEKGIVDAGSELVTLENMYTSENEKLLFPFR